MHADEVTTPKALQQASFNNGDQSFRVLYYGTASAGSVPFMWESQPGTPKHPLTESSLPPLTPPPSYHHSTQKYNSNQLHSNSKRLGFFRSVFLASSSSRKRNTAVSELSSCSSSSSSSSTTRLESWRTTPVEVRRVVSVDDGDCSPTSTLCLGGELKRMLSIVRNGKA